MGSKKKHWLALALSLNLFFAQTAPLLAASTRQLQDTVRNSGLVGTQFQVWRQGTNLRVETDQIYPDRDELKLALIQLASLIESTDSALERVTLRGYLLNNPQAVEGSIAPRTATRLQQEGDPDMLSTINLATARKTSSSSGRKSAPVIARVQDSGNDIPVLGEPIDPPSSPPPRVQKSAKRPVTASKDIPVIGEPLFPGQKVVEPASADDDTPAPFQTGVSILRAGSPIPVMLNRDIVVDGNRAVPVEAIVLEDILSDSGQLVIPGGSQVRGVVEPTPSGARLKLRELYVGDRQYSIQAASSVYPAQQQYGGNGSGGLIGGLAGSFGGMAIGNSLNNRGGGLWGGLLGGLLGSWMGSSMSQPVRRTTTVIPAGMTNAQLLEDLSITSY